MIRANEARLIISAALPSQFPDTQSYEIVMAGKSNVGKSTLINAITNRKRLAYVGQRPGKTRLVNFYQINEDLILVDVPGYGFANRSYKEQDDYAILMEAYFSERAQKQAMILVMDARREISEDDEMMLDLAKSLNLPCMIVLSKMDKLSFSKQKQKINNTKQITGYPVYGFSSMNKESVDQINNQIKIWMRQM